MNLNQEAIQTAKQYSERLKMNGVSAADFFSVLNYDNIGLILDKMEILESEVKKLESEVKKLKNEVTFLKK